MYDEPFRKAFYSVIKIVAITFGLVILLGRRNQWGGRVAQWGVFSFIAK